MRVICAVCNKPVESLSTAFDALREAQYFMAKCHGSVDIRTIPYIEYAADPNLQRKLEEVEGVAFDQLQIEAKNGAVQTEGN